MAKGPHILTSLVEQLDLEQVDLNLYRGESTSLGPPRVFGGQVLGQALIAALRTVPARPCHSLHAYFIRPGDPALPIVFEVDRIRDGRSFATRRVVAVQKGRAIFSLSASFHGIEPGPAHQDPMPDVPPPDECYTDADLIKDPVIREQMAFMRSERPIEIRRVEPISWTEPSPREPRQHMWMRARDALPDDSALHQCIAAYASDMGLLSTSALPHGESFFTGLQSASLDHAMWFHDELRFDEWVLFAMESPVARGNRGYNHGRMYAADGRLVASVAQEGLIRPPQRNR